jgi:succinate dehydrogenase / fumarate reductase flavoprotein subunit
MYEKITDSDPYKEPMQIYPAIHYTMGGTWVDYNLMTSVPGLYSIGEANFSDHGANRLGASALMQGLADGYFVLPYTIGDYLADEIQTPKINVNAPEFEQSVKEVKGRLDKIMAVKGTKPVDYFHKKLGKVMWDYVGMSRNEAGLKKAIELIAEIKAEFWRDVRVPGEQGEVNQELEKAGRVIDFIELADVMTRDALNRNESCGGHFREESVTEEGEAKRNDETGAYVSAWEYKGENTEPVMHKEDLVFEEIKLSQRSYK